MVEEGVGRERRGLGVLGEGEDLRCLGEGGLTLCLLCRVLGIGLVGRGFCLLRGCGWRLRRIWLRSVAEDGE